MYKLGEEQWSIEDNALPVLNKLVAPLSSIVINGLYMYYAYIIWSLLVIRCVLTSHLAI